MQTSSNGSFSVQSVPSFVEVLDNRTNDTNYCGWILGIVYASPASPFHACFFCVM